MTKAIKNKYKSLESNSILDAKKLKGKTRVKLNGIIEHKGKFLSIMEEGYHRCYSSALLWTPYDLNVPIYFAGCYKENYETGDVFSGLGYVDPEKDLIGRGFLITNIFETNKNKDFNDEDYLLKVIPKSPLPDLIQYINKYKID